MVVSEEEHPRPSISDLGGIVHLISCLTSDSHAVLLLRGLCLRRGGLHPAEIRKCFPLLVGLNVRFKICLFGWFGQKNGSGSRFSL